MNATTPETDLREAEITRRMAGHFLTRAQAEEIVNAQAADDARRAANAKKLAVARSQKAK